MLKEIKNYTANNILMAHYFIDENGLQGFYKTYYRNGNVTYETFEFDSCSYGVNKGFIEDKRIGYMKTNKFKQPVQNGVDIEFIY